ncbi:MAG: VOC family protein [Pseudomonadota bacterium]
MSDSKPSFGWGHININVSNLERSISFYEKLGFELFLPAIPYLAMKKDKAQPLTEDMAEALGIVPPPGGRACIMQLDEGFPKLDLTEFSNTASSAPLTNADLGLVRICLISEDLQADVARLKNEGVEFLSDVQVGHDKLGDVALCRDPDGALIELLQVYLERWAPYLDGSA